MNKCVWESWGLWEVKTSSRASTWGCEGTLWRVTLRSPCGGWRVQVDSHSPTEDRTEQTLPVSLVFLLTLHDIPPETQPLSLTATQLWPHFLSSFWTSERLSICSKSAVLCWSTFGEGTSGRISPCSLACVSYHCVNTHNQANSQLPAWLQPASGVLQTNSQLSWAGEVPPSQQQMAEFHSFLGLSKLSFTEDLLWRGGTLAIIFYLWTENFHKWER